MRRRLLISGVIGLALGALAGFGEWLHLGLFVRGAGFQPVILLYAMIVDGGIGLALGLAAGSLWAVLAALRGPQPAVRPASVVRTVWQSEPGMPISEVHIVSRDYGAGPALPEPAGISRRAALQLGVAAASAGALGLGALAWTTKVQRHSGAMAAYASSNDSAATAGPGPNILLVTLDTVRADQIGVYGHPFVKTPAIDQLASQSARFDMHMIQEPQTNPSHASMFTGMYPPSSGVRVHMVDKLPANLETLATIFSAAGYGTAGLYSWMSFDNQYCGFERGFQLYQNVSGDMPGALDNPAARRAAAEFRIAEEYLAAPRKLSNMVGVQQEMEWRNKGRADVTTDAAIAQLQVMAGNPFFMWVHYFDPHYPYSPPPPYDNQYDPDYSGKLDFTIDTIQAIEQGKLDPTPDDVKRLMSLYQGEITFLDSHLGRLFSTLDSLGLSDKTVLALTADHGESFGEHSTFREDTDYFHPHDLYNAEQRTPLLIRYPGHVKPGTVVQAPSQAIDLFPTLLESAGLNTPDQNQGRSLLRLLDGSESGADRAAYGSMPDYVFTSLTVPGWKLIRNNASGSSELYDLRADAGETHELSAANPAMTQQLGSNLQTWMKAMKIS
jgi:arylsulfatase A-like enzyme